MVIKEWDGQRACGMTLLRCRWAVSPPEGLRWLDKLQSDSSSSAVSLYSHHFWHHLLPALLFVFHVALFLPRALFSSFLPCFKFSLSQPFFNLQLFPILTFLFGFISLGFCIKLYHLSEKQYAILQLTAATYNTVPIFFHPFCLLACMLWPTFCLSVFLYLS